MRVAYDPSAVLYHFESKSRNPHVPPAELSEFSDRWGHLLGHDPFSRPELFQGSQGQFFDGTYGLGLNRRVVRSA